MDVGRRRSPCLSASQRSQDLLADHVRAAEHLDRGHAKVGERLSGHLRHGVFGDQQHRPVGQARVTSRPVNVEDTPQSLQTPRG